MITTWAQGSVTCKAEDASLLIEINKCAIGFDISREDLKVALDVVDFLIASRADEQNKIDLRSVFDDLLTGGER